jgi:DNA-binding transcriptional MerR regulator
VFRIGEFAQIAQVSSRQLRFYDQLGMLQPAHTDAQTGYRYYSVRQLPRLNRILALKELGLSLEQIATLLDEEVSPGGLRELLTAKRVEVERALRDEEARLRNIESRIALIDRSESSEGFDVVTKSVQAQPFLSLRYGCEGMDEAVRMVSSVATHGAREIRSGLRDRLIVVARNESETSGLDLEIGYSLTQAVNANVRLADDLVLVAGELPAVDTMATIVRQGTGEDSHASFGALGIWIEANHLAIDGPCREVFLEPVGPTGADRVLIEIQFPVRPVSTPAR